MDTIKAVVEPVKIVPPEFWYACTMILTAVLIWVIQRYFASLQETIREISESIRKLSEMVALHDDQIKQLQAKNGLRRRT